MGSHRMFLSNNSPKKLNAHLTGSSGMIVLILPEFRNEQLPLQYEKLNPLIITSLIIISTAL